MPLQTLEFQPGIDKEGTDYSAKGGWVDGNLVRFRKGRVEKVGGWQKLGMIAPQPRNHHSSAHAHVLLPCSWLLRCHAYARSRSACRLCPKEITFHRVECYFAPCSASVRSRPFACILAPSNHLHKRTDIHREFGPWLSPWPFYKRRILDWLLRFLRYVSEAITVLSPLR